MDEICRQAWGEDNVRPGWEPEKLFEGAFLRCLYVISDHRVEEKAALSFIDHFSRPKDDRFGRKTPQKGFDNDQAHAVMHGGGEFVASLLAALDNLGGQVLWTPEVKP